MERKQGYINELQIMNNNSMIRLNNRLDPLEERTNEVNVISLRISQKEVKMWERIRPNILNNRIAYITCPKQSYSKNSTFLPYL